MNKTIRQQYRKNSKKSLCKSKTAKKCKKIKGCKHVSGKKRSFCRKIKNKRYNKTKKIKIGGRDNDNFHNKNEQPNTRIPTTTRELINKEVLEPFLNKKNEEIADRLKAYKIANELAKQQQIASQANKIKQDKKERDERLNNNETQSNSIETLKPFQSEQKCSTDNLKDCEIEKLLDIINDPKTPQDIKDAAMKKILDIINDPKTSQDIKNAAMKKIM